MQLPKSEMKYERFVRACSFQADVGMRKWFIDIVGGCKGV